MEKFTYNTLHGKKEQRRKIPPNPGSDESLGDFFRLDGSIFYFSSFATGFTQRHGRDTHISARKYHHIFVFVQFTFSSTIAAR
jgi:hypothetical protein